MNYMTNLIQNIIHKKYNFCCLCFKTIEDGRSELDDEVVLMEKSAQKKLKLSQVLSYILGDEIVAVISEFQAICIPCATLCVNSYNFINSTTENLNNLNNIVDFLNNSIDETPSESGECNTLFLTLDDQLTESTPIYTFESFSTTSDALEGLCYALVQLKTPKKEIILPKTDKSDKKNGDRIKIRTVKEIDAEKRKTSKNHPNFYSCNTCCKEFPTIAKLKTHYYKTHTTSEFNCTQCTRSFSTQQLLSQHTTSKHGVFVCNECGRTFTNMVTFKMHEKGHYLRFICQSCGRVYKNRNTYKKHLDNNVCQVEVRHSPADAKFTCDYCQKKYTQKISLRVHIQYEHGNYKAHECKWCKKKFWCQSRLKAHIVKHTKEKNFVCTTCNGRFVTKESLLYHTRLHTGERPYACKLCDSKFLSASRRAAHVKSQHSDGSVKCDICLSKFKSTANLLKHKRIHEMSELEHEVLLNPKEEQMELDEMLHNDKKEMEIDNKNFVYKIVQPQDNVIQLHVENDQTNSKNIEYYCFPEQNSHIGSDGQIYFVSDVGGFENLKVSENVEV